MHATARGIVAENCRGSGRQRRARLAEVHEGDAAGGEGELVEALPPGVRVAQAEPLERHVPDQDFAAVEVCIVPARGAALRKCLRDVCRDIENSAAATTRTRSACEEVTLVPGRLGASRPSPHTFPRTAAVRAVSRSCP